MNCALPTLVNFFFQVILWFLVAGLIGVIQEERRQKQSTVLTTMVVLAFVAAAIRHLSEIF